MAHNSDTVKDLPPVTCTACNGTGIYYEDHGHGRQEPLACRDCRGDRIIDTRFVAHWIRALRASGYTVTWEE